MSVVVWLRIFASVCLAVGLVYDIYAISKRESRGSLAKGKTPLYRPFLSPYLFPLYALLLVLACLLFSGSIQWLERVSFLFLGIFLHISLYYAVLLLAMPYLRRKISSRVCAMLWIIPNYLYLLQMELFKLPEPLWVIRLPAIRGDVLCLVWAAGFVGVLGWKCLSHLRFRKMVLQDAVPVTDPTALRLWGEEQTRTRTAGKEARVKTYIPLVQSDAVTTPLAIGLFRGSLRMVLPDRTYTEEELAWIFRHEIIHIGREDSATKFFLIFCTAMCWFNPLMWIAMGKSAEDLELSCDETVLLGAEETAKRQYAQLLLKTAGDDRGFTTCLSATGQSMRYRLRQVMQAPRRPMGGVLAGILLFGLFMSCGMVALSYDYMTAETAVFGQEGADEYELHSFFTYPSETEDQATAPVAAVDSALRAYLAELEVYRLTADYTCEGSGKSLRLTYENPWMFLSIKDRVIEVYQSDQGPDTKYYYLSEPIDWARIQDILTTGQ